MSDRTIGVTLLGCGVVGAGVAAILGQQRELLRQRTGLTFAIRHAVVRDPKKMRDLPTPLPFSSDAIAAIDDPKTDIVVELIGGTDLAGQYVERALSRGKPVVTANKSLLSSRGPELFALAKKHDTCICFEASCAGGIPIINALIHGLVANRVDALVGIVNGTCNFILTKMDRNGWTYAAALAEAQKAGFAEADPTLDVSGRDAAQKLALLASLAFNARVTEADIHVEGIDSLQDADLKLASELGYVIKLLAIAERRGEKISLRVHPTLVHRDDVLAEVSGSFNAVSVYGNAVGHALFYGRGAGRMPTASAVVADLVQVGLGLGALAFKQLNLLPDSSATLHRLPFEDLTSRYYIRLTARDEPGVMAQVTQALGSHKISLSAILQHEVSDSQLVPVVITTHLAREGDVQSALREINSLATIKPPAVCLRIISISRRSSGVGEEPSRIEPAEEAEQQFRRIRDREALRTLSNGLSIIRCMKHEPLDMGKHSRERIIRLTDKRFGSKFTLEWTLVQYVRWIQEQIISLGWTTETGPAACDVILGRVAGISKGNLVNTIRIVSDGRHVHAYPVEDAHE